MKKLFPHELWETYYKKCINLNSFTEFEYFPEIIVVGIHKELGDRGNVKNNYKTTLEWLKLQR